MTDNDTPMYNLTKDDGAVPIDEITHLRIGASWDPTSGGSGGVVGWAKRKRGTDLDAFAILVQGSAPVRFAGLDCPDPVDNGSVLHSGDNQTGHGDGDDEVIDVIFDRVPRNITSIVFVVVAFKKGSSFAKANKVSMKVYDGTGGGFKQTADIWPSLMETGNACRVARAFRSGSGWKLEVLDEMGRVAQDDRNSLLRFALN
jgi:tellurium resistance protein TerZ